LEGRLCAGREQAIAAPILGPYHAAVVAERFSQRQNLYGQVVFLDDPVRPYPIEQFLFRNQGSIGLDQCQQNVKGSGPQLDRRAVGEQLALARQNPEAAEFDFRLGRGRGLVKRRLVAMVSWRVPRWGHFCLLL
jgi:hypothetical protein